MAHLEGKGAPVSVGVLALPEAVISTLTGLFDVMNSASFMAMAQPDDGKMFDVRIVGESEGALELASGLPIKVQRSVGDVADCDIVIVPSLFPERGQWQTGRYPELVGWLREMHDKGALLCSACSGLFLLAETGLWNGRDATVHFDFARHFETLYPQVRVHPERVLVISGDRDDLVSSGASNTWHDLVLYLTARYAGATTAQAVARAFALQWHQDGLTPFIVFEGRRDHGDAEIENAQAWLATHFSVANPVEEMVRRSTLAERTFKRRFTEATGFPPIEYVQRLRVEDAKRRLERTEAPIDEISWRVGYEDATFFRRLFKRTTGMAPGAYRKRFRVPNFALAQT